MISASAAGASPAAEAPLALRAESFLREQWRARGEIAPPDEAIAETVRLAVAARARYAWGESVPEELFFRYVLPDVNLTEPRTAWRADLESRLAPLVAGARSAGDAAVRLNDGMWKKLGMAYSAEPMRPPALPPEQAIRRGKSSCTSLAILLVDACRALAIPARVAGIPAWVRPEGNTTIPPGGFHQWVEVWDGTWRSLSAIDSSPLDGGWFAERAAKTETANPRHRLYAASFAPTGAHFPLPWARGNRTVPGIDVTPLYTHRRAVRFELPAGARLAVRRAGELFAVARDEADEILLGEGESYEWTIVDAAGRELGRGRLELAPSTPSKVRLLAAGAQAGSRDGSNASHSRTSSPPSPQAAHFAIEPRYSR